MEYSIDSSELSLDEVLEIAGVNEPAGDVLFDYVEGLYEDADRDLVP
jgi:hypothetical protein